MGLTIAITGASGFVGRHLVKAAATHGLEVVGLHRQPAGEAIIRQAGGRPIRVRGLHPAPLARAFTGCAAVVHLAQVGSERPGATYDQVNVAGTRHVLDAAQRAGVRVCAYLSGLGVAHYGMKPRCTNRYFLSKLRSEIELFRSALRVAVFRPSFILGPGGELVNDLLAQIAAGRVEVVGDGSYRLQPLSVVDAADALVRALTQDGPRHAVYDLVGPEAVTFRQLVDRVARIAEPPGRSASFVMQEVAVEAAEAQAVNVGYRGMSADSLDCLLCDETSDPSPLVAFLGRPLRSIDEIVESAAAEALAAS